MPFPANWLEELVIEWLDHEGFAISTSVFVPANAGGRFSPDAVGAKRQEDGTLVIRHYEAAMHLIDKPEKVAERYSKKFSPKIEQAVRKRFGQIFGCEMSEKANYQKYIVCINVSENVYSALDKIHDVKIRRLADFIREDVLPSIDAWRAHHTKTTQIPADKWLLHMIDWFRYVGLIAGEKPGLIKHPGSTESKTAATKTSPAKTGPKPRPETLSHCLTDLLIKGGKIQEITEQINVEADRRKLKKLTAGQVRAHAKWLSSKGAYTVKEDASGFIQTLPAA